MTKTEQHSKKSDQADVTTQNGNPPASPKRISASAKEFHEISLRDDLQWMRDRDNPEVIARLEAENQWYEKATSHLAPLRENLVAEIRSHSLEAEVFAPARRGNWWYLTRLEEGKSYHSYYRIAAKTAQGTSYPKVEAERGPEEQLLLDVNTLADGHEFTRIANFSVAPNERYLVFGVDHSGDEVFDLQVHDLESGEEIEASVRAVVYGIAWNAQSTGFYYVRADESWRSNEIWYHALGQPQENDQLILREDDPTFDIGVEGSRDGNWILITSSATDTTEQWLMPSMESEWIPRSIWGRIAGFDASVEPAGDQLLIVHGSDGEFSLSTATHPAQTDFRTLSSTCVNVSIPEAATKEAVIVPRETWELLLSPAAGERFLGVHAFATHAALSLRAEGFAAVRPLVRKQAPTGEGTASGWEVLPDLATDMEVRTVEIGVNPWWESPSLRIRVESLIQPATDLDFFPATGELVRRREMKVPGYDASQYRQWREWATAEDGTLVPISIAAHKDCLPDGSAPGLLYGYGSYEVSIDPVFSVTRLPLLKRGAVFAIAHVRGGGEMGRSWYENGRRLKKRNTFTDFIAAADHLVEKGIVAADRLCAEGRSAGGLLMGAITNLAPHRFCAVHAGVPFVDALTTILDPTLPLTAGEWEEWGNPIESEEVFDYMRSYSPCENVTSGTAYPSILITTGLNDVRVSYYEPLKWVALLREATTSDPITTPLLLHCEMVAGHGGRSGRYAAWEERSEELAFLLDRMGCK